MYSENFKEGFRRKAFEDYKSKKKSPLLFEPEIDKETGSMNFRQISVAGPVLATLTEKSDRSAAAYSRYG